LSVSTWIDCDVVDVPVLVLWPHHDDTGKLAADLGNPHPAFVNESSVVIEHRCRLSADHFDVGRVGRIDASDDATVVHGECATDVDNRGRLHPSSMHNRPADDLTLP
jgi:hypothetical protein